MLIYELKLDEVQLMVGEHHDAQMSRSSGWEAAWPI